MNSNKFVTYIIRDPRDQTPVYVGQTCDFARRKIQHTIKAQGRKLNIGTVNINTYLVDLFSLGYLPSFEKVDECQSEEKSLISETLWVQKLVAVGYPLLNRHNTHRQIVKSRFKSDFLKEYWRKRFDLDAV